MIKLPAKRFVTRGLVAGLAVVFLCAAALAQKPLPAKPIDLNTAPAVELQRLPGVGAETARKIIEMRQKSGPFRRVEDLLAIRGISRKRLEQLRPYIVVSPPPVRKK